MKKYIVYLNKFCDYLWNDDSLGSYLLNFFVAFIFIKFIFFPVVGFALNNDFTVVAIVSGSMEHKIVNNQICDKFIIDQKKKSLDFDSWWNFCSNYYQEYLNLTKNDFLNYKYQNGLNIGDGMILYGKDPKKIQVGEVLVFIPQDKRFFQEKGPVIHRVVKKWTDENNQLYFKTKGDHNPQVFQNFEDKIPAENVIGVGVVRIPFIGYAKLA